MEKDVCERLRNMEKETFSYKDRDVNKIVLTYKHKNKIMIFEISF